MDLNTIFLFGAAEKGPYGKPLKCTSMPQLFDTCGIPPEGSEGISYAMQTLLFERELIFFRVEEEGFSADTYRQGLKILCKAKLDFTLGAICMPGLGDREIIEAAGQICSLHRSFLILNQKDLYDYLTAK